MDNHKPSPFSQYLNTNYAPSDSEATSLKLLVEDRKATAAALTKEFEKATRTPATHAEEKKIGLAVMEQRLAVDRQFIAGHTMLLSPIRRISQDVLILVFQTFVETMEQPGHPEFWRVPSSNVWPTTTISHVCAGWRKLALQTPTLWAHIHVMVPDLDPEEVPWTNWCRMMETQRHQVETWINRSSSCAVDVGLAIGTVGSSTRSEHLEGARKFYDALVETLLPTSHRWRSIYCNWELDKATESVVNLFDGPQFSLLRNATFFVNVDNWNRPEPRALGRRLSRSTLFATPTLREVTLAMYWENPSVAKASSTSPLYDSITHFSYNANPIDTGSHFGGAEALDLLKSLPNLISAQISLRSPSPPLRPHSPPIHLPRLTSLRLRFEPVPKGFAPSLQLPRLECLHLGHSVEHDLPPAHPPNATGQDEFLLQEGSKLKELSLHHDGVPRENLAQYFDMLSNLTVLNVHAALPRSLHHSDEPDMHLLSQLTIPGVLPRLQELELHDLSNKEGGPLENAVVDFLAEKVLGCTEGGAGGRKGGRTERPTALRRVVIHFAHPKRVDIIGALRSRGCSLDGIDLGLTYRSRS